MPDGDFITEVLTDEVIVGHREEGHVFRFPVLAKGSVSLHGCRIEPNLKAKREARHYIFDAHDVARAAFARMRLGRQPTSGC